MFSLGESSYNYVVLRERLRSVHDIDWRRWLNGNSTSYFELTFVRLGEVGACPHVVACPHTLLFAAARNIWP